MKFDAFNIKPPRAIECVTRKKDDGRCDIEVEGHVDHVETGEPIKVKSHTVVMYPPTAEDFRSLLVTFFDHEVREQLGMDPHGPPSPIAINLVRERDAALQRVAEMEAEEQRSTEYLREVLRKVDEEQKGLAVCSWCALPTNSDPESKRSHQMTCPKSPLVARVTELEAKNERLIAGIRNAMSEKCATCQKALLATSPFCSVACADKALSIDAKPST